MAAARPEGKGVAGRGGVVKCGVVGHSRASNGRRPRRNAGRVVVAPNTSPPRLLRGRRRVRRIRRARGRAAHPSQRPAACDRVAGRPTRTPRERSKKRSRRSTLSPSRPTSTACTRCPWSSRSSDAGSATGSFAWSTTRAGTTCCRRWRRSSRFERRRRGSVVAADATTSAPENGAVAAMLARDRWELRRRHGAGPRRRRDARRRYVIRRVRDVVRFGRQLRAAASLRAPSPRTP